MFTLTEDPIVRAVADDFASGAFVTFEGRVRNEHQGQPVVALEYECEPTLCQRIGDALVVEATELHGVLSVEMTHRMGRLELGELALLVEVRAAHRREAFAACEWIIDEIKRRLPIWKKEHYASGDSGWVGTDTAPTAAPVTEGSYFDRQMRLPDVGPTGQAALRKARVLVVGIGGLGCPVVQYLAAAGVGHLTLCDGDRVDASNLHRQVLFGANDVGKPKASLAASKVRTMTPFVEINGIDRKLTRVSGPEMVRGADLVVDCSDNFRTKFLLNDLCVDLGKPLVQASIYQSEGQISLYDPAATAGCLRCLWPETPPTDCVGTCAEVGVLGAIPGVFGALQASVTLRYLLGHSSPLASHVLLFDLVNFESHLLRRQPNLVCPGCGTDRKNLQGLEVDLEDLSEDQIKSVTVLDVRELDEPRPRIAALMGAWVEVPRSQLPEAIEGLDRESTYLVVCKSGVRSLQSVREMRKAGFESVQSLARGIG